MRVCVLLACSGKKFCPVADLSSNPAPLGLLPKLSDKLCLRTDVAALESIKQHVFHPRRDLPRGITSVDVSFFASQHPWCCGNKHLRLSSC